MSDRFSLVPVRILLNWILKEYEAKGEIFGIPKELFFNPTGTNPLEMKRYGETLETPFGVAAGPHTQMAQNIISAWLVGGRYIELKTVQTLDEIDVSKPCIDMEDEGYNCEWSQELKLEESFQEYLKAWIIIHILQHKFGWRRDDGDLGCIFNMSVGYSFEGIQNENVQKFLSNMKDASELKALYFKELSPFYPEVVNLNIPDCLSNSLTLSTMHGCPPDEIERIATYLIEEQKLHTTVKLNPTLLGPDELRGILNDKLGFVDSHVPDIAFEHDLKYADATGMIARLETCAQKAGVDFALKLTNTLEVENHKDFFPENEKMMYMSGRALHAPSVNLAQKLQTEFDGKLDISFSAGGDAYNVADILKTNIKPITVCSDLLKPGGYGRYAQYTEQVKAEMTRIGADNLDALVTKSGHNDDLKTAASHNLKVYAKTVLTDPRYKKEEHPWPLIKGARKLDRFDCIKAPCITTCPTGQEIPEYMYLTAKGDYDGAMKVIQESNPFPHSTGMACDHICQNRCTRTNYDSPLLIRDIKRFVASNGKSDTVTPAAPNSKSVGIIGGGPSGLSAAFYLAKEGFKVTVYEAKSPVGGMLTHALPDFRALKDRVHKDLDRIKAMGVTIIENHPVTTKDGFEKIYGENDYTYLAVGASKGKSMRVENEDTPGIIDFLDFLDQAKQGEITQTAAKVAIIGGGNSAMDAARTVWRMLPKGGDVKILYRRTEAEMPADLEEIKMLKDEGIEVVELTAPAKVITENGKLKALECYKMELGTPDDSGRRRPIKIEGSEHQIELDWVIKAIGQDTVLDFLGETDIELTPWKTVKTDDLTHATSRENLFAGGDVVRGPASIIKAVADGKEVAYEIIKKEGYTVKRPSQTVKEISHRELRLKKAKRITGIELPESKLDNRRNFNTVVRDLTVAEATEEANRCLYCDEICDICVTVCPNRANVAYKTEAKSYSVADLTLTADGYTRGTDSTFRVEQGNQVLNIGDFCNECGNCDLFCPSAGQPYKAKPKFFLSEASFLEEKGDAFVHMVNGGSHMLIARINGATTTLDCRPEDKTFTFKTNEGTVILNRSDLSVVSTEVRGEGGIVPLSAAAQCAVLLDAFINDLTYL